MINVLAHSTGIIDSCAHHTASFPLTRGSRMWCVCGEDFYVPPQNLAIGVVEPFDLSKKHILPQTLSEPKNLTGKAKRNPRRKERVLTIDSILAFITWTYHNSFPLWKKEKSGKELIWANIVLTGVLDEEHLAQAKARKDKSDTGCKWGIMWKDYLGHCPFMLLNLYRTHPLKWCQISRCWLTTH